jgi:hypothetical protein
MFTVVFGIRPTALTHTPSPPSDVVSGLWRSKLIVMFHGW